MATQSPNCCNEYIAQKFASRSTEGYHTVASAGMAQFPECIIGQGIGWHRRPSYKRIHRNEDNLTGYFHTYYTTITMRHTVASAGMAQFPECIIGQGIGCIKAGACGSVSFGGELISISFHSVRSRPPHSWRFYVTKDSVLHRCPT